MEELGRPHGTKKAAQREATRARLIAAARELFGTHGFAGVGTEAIVRAAGVTRGALYHQFAGKRDLFRAVFEEVETEIIARVATRASDSEEPLGELVAGVGVWLDAVLEPEVQRIVLLDAPSVLGYEECHALGEQYALGLILSALEGAQAAGALPAGPVGALGHIILGALDEAALYVARADDSKRARAEAEAVLMRLLGSLRA